MKNKKERKKPTSPERERTINIIISIVIALVLWAYVIGQVNPTTTQVINNVPVQLLNVESLTSRGLAVAGDSEFNVDVVVKGTRSDIAALGDNKVVAQADLFGWSKGENFVPVTVTVPDGIDLVEVRTDKIKVTIEKLVAVSKPVEIVYTGTLNKSEEVGAVQIKPEQIEVTGASSDVATVDKIQVVVPVNALSAAGEIVQAEVIPITKDGMEVPNVKLSASYVNVFAKIDTLKEVKLSAAFTGDLGNGLGAETKVPDTIWIKGGKDVLKSIDSVSTQPVDLTGMKKDGTVSLSVILPDGVELSQRNAELTAGISIVDVGTKTFTYSPDKVLIEGLTKGKSVSMDSASIEVTVSAKKEVISDLTAADLKLYIDVTDATAGVQNAKIQVDSDASLQTVTIKPEKISINVKSAEGE
jgi:YbbR domain-containing protein